MFLCVLSPSPSHPDSTETYIGVLTGLDSDDAPSIIRKLIRDPIFNVALAGHARTAVRMWAGIRKRSLLTDDGRALTVELFAMIGKVNQYSAQSFIGTETQDITSSLCCAHNCACDWMLC